jgi:addiction module HigA family antidote
MTSRSSTITADDARRDDDRLPPVHPGEILLEDFLKPMAISQYRLARSLGVPAQRIHDLVHGRRAITADTALRLARFFTMEAQFWMNLQSRYDLEVAADTLQERIVGEVQPLVA